MQFHNLQCTIIHRQDISTALLCCNLQIISLIAYINATSCALLIKAELAFTENYTRNCID
jgi:hypothetical protein